MPGIPGGLPEVVWAMKFSALVSLVGGYRHQEAGYQDVWPDPGLTFHFRFDMNGLILCNH